MPAPATSLDAGCGIDVALTCSGTLRSRRRRCISTPIRPGCGPRWTRCPAPVSRPGCCGDHRRGSRGGPGHPGCVRVRAGVGRDRCSGARPHVWPAMLDPAFLVEAGWDPPDSGVVPARSASAAGSAGVPGRRLRRHRPQWPARGVLPLLHQADPAGDDRGRNRGRRGVAGVAHRPRISARCRGAGARRRCARRCCASRTSRQFRRRRPPVSMEQFLADPRVQAVAAGGDLPGGGVHPDGRRRSRLLQYPLSALASGPAEPTPAWIDRWWQARESGVAEPGQVNLRALPPLVVVEVLFGMQQRVRGGAKITDVDLRVLCDALRRQQVASIAVCETGGLPTRQVSSLAQRVGPSRSPGAGRPRQRAGQGHLGPGAVRPSRLPVVHRDRSAVAGPGRQAVGGRAVAAPPRRRRRPGPRQDQRAGAAVGVPGLPDRIADSSRRRWAAATSRASSTGWPTWSRPARSAATAATASAATCGRSWPGSAPWA